MADLKNERINELYHKSKAEGLTDEEKAEQQLLRKEYLAAISTVSAVNTATTIIPVHTQFQNLQKPLYYKAAGL